MTPEEELQKKQLEEAKQQRNLSFIHLAQNLGAKSAKEALDIAKEFKKFVEG